VEVPIEAAMGQARGCHDFFDRGLREPLLIEQMGRGVQYSLSRALLVVWRIRHDFTSALVKDDLEHLLWPVTILSTVEFGVRWGKTPPLKHPGASLHKKSRASSAMSGAGRYATNR